MAALRAAAVAAAVADDKHPGVTPLAISAAEALADPRIFDADMFGPASVVIVGAAPGDLEIMASRLDGQLTARIFAHADDDIRELVRVLQSRVGRILFNEWPTGVSVTYAQQHGARTRQRPRRPHLGRNRRGPPVPSPGRIPERPTRVAPRRAR